MTSAASLSAFIGGLYGVSVSGAGAAATNVILTKTKAYAENTDIIGAGDLRIEAENASSITAKVATASAALSAGGIAGVGASIGASYARNLIGWEWLGNRLPADVLAYILDSSVVTDGDLALTAKTTQTIDATVLSGSAAISAAGLVGGGASGAGAVTENRVANKVNAFINGDNDAQVLSRHLTLSAKDDSSIVADTGAASLAAAFAGAGSATLSVGLALARNKISSEVEAYLEDIDENVRATNGDILIEAVSSSTITAKTIGTSAADSLSLGVSGAISGAGAEATNLILTQTNAYIINSDMTATGGVTLSASNTSAISATIRSWSAALGGGLMAGAASIGSASARNLIGWDLSGKRIPMEVQAYIENSSVDAGGALSQSALSSQSITALVKAGSMAFSAGLIAGSESAAGVQAENMVAGKVRAYFDGKDTKDLKAESIAYSATNSSVIKADVEASSLSASLAPYGAALATSGADAYNEIGNEVEAFIQNVQNNVVTTGGGITLNADETATIDARTAAASIAASLTASTSEAGTKAVNTITTGTKAFIENSDNVTAAGNIRIHAASAPTMGSEIVAASLAAGFKSGAGAQVISRNTVEDSVQAFVSGSTLTAAAGDIDISAVSTPQIDTIAATVAAAVGSGSSRVTADTTIRGVVEAFVDSSGLTADSGTVTVDAEGVSTATPDVTGVAVSAGASVGVVDYTSLIEGKTHAFVTGTTSSINAGQIDITATDTNSAAPDITQINVGGLTIGMINATPVITRETVAFVGKNVVLNAGHDDLNLRAESVSAVNSSITGVSLSLVASIDVLNQGGRITNNTAVYIDKNAEVTAGDIVLDANSDSTLTSIVDQVSISLGAIGAMSVDNIIEGATEAYVEEKALVTADNLTMEAAAKNEATSDLLYVGVGLGFAGSDARSEARINSDVNAFIGPRADTLLTVSDVPDIDISGDIVVRAISIDDAFAGLEGGTGSLIGAGNNMKPTATVNNYVQAYIGENTHISATNLTLTTEDSTGSKKTSRSAEADVISGSVGGLGAGSDAEAVAVIDGEVSTYIAAGAFIDTGLGTTTLQSDSVGVADAFGHGGTGSVGISVALFGATARIGDNSADPASGTTSARVDDGARIKAANLKIASTSDNYAVTDLLAVSVGLAGGGGAGKVMPGLVLTRKRIFQERTSMWPIRSKSAADPLRKQRLKFEAVQAVSVWGPWILRQPPTVWGQPVPMSVIMPRLMMPAR